MIGGNPAPCRQFYLLRESDCNGLTCNSPLSVSTASQAASQPAGGQRRRGDGTEESRNARSKSRLDKSTAASRARGTEYRRLKDQRRIELGLSPRG